MKKKIILDNEKLNNDIEAVKDQEATNAEETAADDIPRLDNGNIDIEKISTGKDQKNNYIVPDDLFDKYYKELPRGTVNESKTYRAYNGGKVKSLTSDNIEIQRQGGYALQAKLKERRTFAEAIATVLAQKPSEEVKKELNLDSTADNLDAVIAAMLRQATRGNVKAGDFLRDTIGQKPSDRLEATVENLTPEDREMLENIKNRLDS